jgi:hypothetical protein
VHRTRFSEEAAPRAGFSYPSAYPSEHQHVRFPVRLPHKADSFDAAGKGTDTAAEIGLDLGPARVHADPSGQDAAFPFDDGARLACGQSVGELCVANLFHRPDTSLTD